MTKAWNGLLNVGVWAAMLVLGAGCAEMAGNEVVPAEFDEADGGAQVEPEEDNMQVPQALVTSTGAASIDTWTPDDSATFILPQAAIGWWNQTTAFATAYNIDANVQVDEQVAPQTAPTMPLRHTASVTLASAQGSASSWAEITLKSTGATRSAEIRASAGSTVKTSAGVTCPVVNGLSTCSLTYAWQQGRSYRLRFWETSPTETGMWIKDSTTGVETMVGSAVHPVNQRLSRYYGVTTSSNFVGTANSDCIGLGALYANWTSVTVNNNTSSIAPIYATSSATYGKGYCRNAKVTTNIGGLIFLGTIGQVTRVSMNVFGTSSHVTSIGKSGTPAVRTVNTATGTVTQAHTFGLLTLDDDRIIKLQNRDGTFSTM